MAAHYTGPAFIGTVGTVCSDYLPWAFYATFLCSSRFRDFVTHTVSNRPSALCGMLPTTLLRDCPAIASHHVSRHGLCRLLTIENRATKHLLSSGRRGSNPRHQPWKGCTLPTELLPRRTAFTLFWPVVSNRLFRLSVVHRPSPFARNGGI